MKPPANMRDVALMMNVSIATVSKALANKSDISVKTRQRILAACTRLGYKSNALIAALMRTRRRHLSPATGLTLAFVTAFPMADGWRPAPGPDHSSGKLAGILVRDEQEIGRFQRMGFTHIAVDSDLSILRNAYQRLLKSREKMTVGSR